MTNPNVALLLDEPKTNSNLQVRTKKVALQLGDEGGDESRPRRSYGRRGYGGGGRGGYSRTSRSPDREGGPAPVEEGQEVDVTVESVGRRGDGIARINNFVVFVPGTNTGDKVKVRITSVRGSFATGEVVRGE